MCCANSASPGEFTNACATRAKTPSNIPPKSADARLIVRCSFGSPAGGLVRSVLRSSALQGRTRPAVALLGLLVSGSTLLHSGSFSFYANSSTRCPFQRVANSSARLHKTTLPPQMRSCDGVIDPTFLIAACQRTPFCCRFRVHWVVVGSELNRWMRGQQKKKSGPMQLLGNRMEMEVKTNK